MSDSNKITVQTHRNGTQDYTRAAAEYTDRLKTSLGVFEEHCDVQATDGDRAALALGRANERVRNNGFAVVNAEVIDGPDGVTGVRVYYLHRRSNPNQTFELGVFEHHEDFDGPDVTDATRLGAAMRNSRAKLAELGTLACNVQTITREGRAVGVRVFYWLVGANTGVPHEGS